jgi:hypothetical protein
MVSFPAMSARTPLGRALAALALGGALLAAALPAARARAADASATPSRLDAPELKLASPPSSRFT